MDYDAIIKEIETYMGKFKSYYSEWYVGIAFDPKDRLFNDHKVDEKGIWIHRGADSDDVARDVEKYFIEQRKTDGGTGGGDSSTKIVYAYKKNTNTDP